MLVDCTSSLRANLVVGPQDGWEFSSGANRGLLEREEQLARDINVLLEQVQPQQQQQQQPQQQRQQLQQQWQQEQLQGSAAVAPASSGMTVRKRGRPRKGQPPLEDARPGLQQQQQQQQPQQQLQRSQQQQQQQVLQGPVEDGQLTPLHIAILRLRLGLMSGRTQVDVGGLTYGHR